MNVEEHPDPLEDGDECPLCQFGTVGLEEGELRCRGECGTIFNAKNPPLPTTK